MKFKMIGLPEEVKKKLDKLKIHRKQPYHELISELIENYTEMKK